MNAICSQQAPIQKLRHRLKDSQACRDNVHLQHGSSRYNCILARPRVEVLCRRLPERGIFEMSFHTRIIRHNRSIRTIHNVVRGLPEPKNRVQMIEMLSNDLPSEGRFEWKIIRGEF